MKVLHILNTGMYSGAENVAISIVNYLKDEEKYNATYMALKGPIEEILKKNNIHYHLVDKLTILSIKKIIEIEKPDIIHAHDFTASILTIFTMKNIPVISHIHNNPPWIRTINIKSLIYGLTCFKYKKILTVSSAVMEEYILGNIFIKKSLVIGNPVLINLIKEKAGRAKEQRSFDILYLGRFTLQKDPETFLKIIKFIKDKIPNIKVGMIGTGEIYEDIIKKIYEMSLQSNIFCPGFIENPYGIVDNSKILCIPSKWEGFGLVAVEALALGKPVVASNVGGLPYIITESSGKICNEMSDYTNEIYRLLTDIKYYNLKSRGALKRAKELDNSSVYFGKIKNIYIKLGKNG